MIFPGRKGTGKAFDDWSDAVEAVFDWKAYEKEQFPDGPDGLGQELLLKARARHSKADPCSEGRAESLSEKCEEGTMGSDAEGRTK